MKGYIGMYREALCNKRTISTSAGKLSMSRLTGDKFPYFTLF